MTKIYIASHLMRKLNLMSKETLVSDFQYSRNSGCDRFIV